MFVGILKGPFDLLSFRDDIKFKISFSFVGLIKNEFGFELLRYCVKDLFERNFFFEDLIQW